MRSGSSPWCPVDRWLSLWTLRPACSRLWEPRIEKQLRLGKLAQQLAIAVDQRDVVLSKTALNKADVSRCIVNLVEVQEALRGGVDSLIPRDTLAEVQALLSSTLQAPWSSLSRAWVTTRPR